jgi:uncharacterized membrane protein
MPEARFPVLYINILLVFIMLFGMAIIVGSIYSAEENMWLYVVLSFVCVFLLCIVAIISAWNWRSTDDQNDESVGERSALRADISIHSYL